MLPIEYASTPMHPLLQMPALAAAKTIRVAANGINFEVLTLGDGDQLAICLHGFPENAYCWRFQMPLLARLGYRVWAPNLRGYGTTDSPRNIDAYRMEVLVEDVAGLIRAAGAKETVMIGHDWGGALAWNLASWLPALVQRLVVLNAPHPACFVRELKRPGQLMKSWYIFFFQLPVLPEWLLGLDGARGIASIIRRTTCNRSCASEEILDVYRQNSSRRGGLTGMLNWYRALLRGGAIGRFRKREVPRIEIPTLFIWGGADRFLSARTTVGTEKYVANLSFRILPGVSHWVQEEAPEAVNSTLEAWLLDHPVPYFTNPVRSPKP